MLARWLAQPHVARWWGPPPPLDAVAAKYLPRIEGLDLTEMWIVEIDAVSAGVIQSYRHTDYPDHDRAVGIPNAVGIDYFLDALHAGRGLASGVLHAFACHALARYPDCEVCVATPAQANEPSWRSLERAGFERRHACRPPEEPPAFAYAFVRAL
jgi:aminoglycoside 6'-N-acetyltransferase